MAATLKVEGLRIELEGSGHDIVDEVGFSVEAGEVLGLVGESGSGKTTVATSILGHARRGAKIAGGRVLVDGTDVLSLDDGELRHLRGKSVAYVSQDPTAALNPALRIGTHFEQLFHAHEPAASSATRKERILEALADVRLPAEEEFLGRFAHQLSGGQVQRVCLAMAFVLRPRVIVLDEPTTGLDVTTQAHVLDTVRRLCETHGVAGLYVTHDLAVVANLASRVMVMYAGRTIELGPLDAVFTAEAHPYTTQLVAAIPVVEERRQLAAIPGHAPSPGRRPTGCSFAPRCPRAIEVCSVEAPPVVEVGGGHFSRCHRALEVRNSPSAVTVLPPAVLVDDAPVVIDARDVSVSYGTKQVLFDVGFELHQRECLALVGESGSGKTTLARTVIGLVPPSAGTIAFKGQPLGPTARQRPADLRRAVQYIFQSPYNSLNPRKTVGASVQAPLAHFFGLKGSEASDRATEALGRVQLPGRFMDALPHQLSGGERQRVAIARALVCEPEVLICDEITSALDVSVQAAIVELLADLQRTTNLSLLFVTHNLGLVRSAADRVLVMDHGRVVERGSVQKVLDEPEASYTRQLLGDTPTLELSRAT